MPTDPYCSPLLHSKLAELPKTYIAICGKDTLRDDARLLAAALKEGGYGPTLKSRLYETKADVLTAAFLSGRLSMKVCPTTSGHFLRNT